MPQLVLMLVELTVFAVLAVLASLHYGIDDGIRITAANAVAYIIPRIVLTRARGSNTASLILLLVLTVFLIAIDYTRMYNWSHVEDYSLRIPNVQNDARGYYGWALDSYYGNTRLGEIPFPGFPLMMVALWKLFGISVVWPVAMNMSFTLLSVVLTGMFTRRLLIGRVSASPTVLLNGGMFLTAILFYYLMIGTSVLKEGSIYLSMTMAAFALASMTAIDEERHRPWLDFALFVIACLLMAGVRTTYLYFIALGIIVMALPNWRRDWMMSLAMFAVFFIALLVGDHFASYSFERHAEIIGGGWDMQRFYITGESQLLYREVLDYYFLYSPWHRMLMLPLTMSVQFIIPLPWNYYEHQSFLNLLSRMTWGWYLVGGTALFYFAVISWRRRENMGAWPWWPAISFAAMAYVMAGSTARYVLPIEPLFVPVAMFVFCRLAEGQWRRQYKLWCVVFIVLTVAALVVCHLFQRGILSGLLPAPAV